MQALLGIVAVAAAAAIYKARSSSQEAAQLKEIVEGMERERGELQGRVRALEEESSALKRREEELQRKYEADFKALKDRERRVIEDSQKLEEGLAQINVLKETIELHRLKVGALERDKITLRKRYEAEIEDLKEKVRTLTEATKDQVYAEKERLEKEVGELNEKLQELVDASSGMERLKAENEALKEKLAKAREELTRYGLG